ncbi:MAG: hemolysin family protein [Candidatus Parcubacteria bacterium]|nr:hemolysin family protein [Candidatus Parcubacteria bacterium]
MEYIIFFVLVALSAFFSSAETAYFSIRHSQVRIMQEHKKKNANLVHRLKDDPERLLITILIGNNIVIFASASFATMFGINHFGAVGAGIATVVATFVMLVFGEIFPKTIAIAHYMTMTRLFAKPLYFFVILFSPLTWLLLKLHHFANTAMQVKKQPLVSEEEIRAMSRLGVEHGAIDVSEQEMIEKIFRFDDVKVGDIMTPIDKVEILNGDVPVEQIAYFVSQSGFSRFPVHDGGTAEKIVGYVHVNDIMKALNSDDRERPVIDLIDPIKCVSENRTVDSIFRSMQKSRHHLYLVYEDEHKTATGIVTMENVLEEIVGEIKDETDD